MAPPKKQQGPFVTEENLILHLLESLKDTAVIDTINKLINRKALLDAIDIEHSNVVLSLKKQLQAKEAKL